MKANPNSLNNLLSERLQWIVPVYQRHYEWDVKKQLPPLWEDLRDKALEILEGRKKFPHYFGAIICSEPVSRKFGAVLQRHLIDGQQRITTFNILLAALREVAIRNDSDRLSVALNTFLFNEQNEGMIDPEKERFKLWPSSYDRDLFQQIAGLTFDELKEKNPRCFYKNGKFKKGAAAKLLQSHFYLIEQIEGFIKSQNEVDRSSEDVLDSLVEGFLNGFQVVLIELDENDDAQEIFASLNGLSKPLTPFDLIRNDVFHRTKSTGEDSEALFEGRWKTFERPYWNTQVRQGRLKRARADHLIAHTVVAETGREVSVAKIATEYQHYARERNFSSVADELDILLTHADTYRAMEAEADKSALSDIADLLRRWDSSVFHPLVFAINAHVEHDTVKSKLFAILVSYLIRREICGLTSKNYNKVVTGMIRTLKKSEDPVASLNLLMAGLVGDTSRFPDDAEFLDAFLTKGFYGSIPPKRLRYIFLKIESSLRTRFDEVMVIDEALTIEHIMPQDWPENWPLPNGETSPVKDAWQLTYLGDEDDATATLSEEGKKCVAERAKLINTAGNLTLLNNKANPSLGNKGWGEKQLLFRDSLLALNREVGNRPCWDEQAIKERGAMLGQVACKLWKAHNSQPLL